MRDCTSIVVQWTALECGVRNKRECRHMREETALELAVGLLQLPSRVRALRDAPLPRDVDALLNIVTDEGRALSDAVRKTGLTERTVSDAASFYIEQVLLHPGADSYRALGASADATNDQLRKNMALLLRWLHPDREANSERAIYAVRITEAWNNIKTAERRSAYDAVRSGVTSTGTTPRGASHASSATASSPGKDRAAVRPARPKATLPKMRTRTGSRRTRRRGPLWRILELLLAKVRRKGRVRR